MVSSRLVVWARMLAAQQARRRSVNGMRALRAVGARFFIVLFGVFGLFLGLGATKINPIMKTKKLLPLLTMTIALLALAASSISAQPKATTSNNEWLQFRGPNGTGVADGFALPA